ncbi:hypothetical protein [Bradyrhizobium sp. B120]|uniref:hypothetical protein n=1 Tax=Bradyrhizobium sp. B120 TaxID=3410088 RepID=UPI003B987AF9
MYQGQTVNEIVTGKPISAGGTLGRREATGRGAAYLVGRALDHLGISAGSATAIEHGFGNVGSVTAYSLGERGVKIIGVSDHTAAYYDPVGSRYCRVKGPHFEMRATRWVLDSEPH